MALTDTFVRQVKHSGRPAGDKYSDGGGMYLLLHKIRARVDVNRVVAPFLKPRR